MQGERKRPPLHTLLKTRSPLWCSPIGAAARWSAPGAGVDNGSRGGLSRGASAVVRASCLTCHYRKARGLCASPVLFARRDGVGGFLSLPGRHKRVDQQLPRHTTNQAVFQRASCLACRWAAAAWA